MDMYHAMAVDVPYWRNSSAATIGAGPPALSYRAMLARDRQRPTAELVDRYQIRCAPVRDALIRYLDERRPGTLFLRARCWRLVRASHSRPRVLRTQ